MVKLRPQADRLVPFCRSGIGNPLFPDSVLVTHVVHTRKCYVSKRDALGVGILTCMRASLVRMSGS